jgi:hypothetical protein
VKDVAPTPGRVYQTQNHNISTFRLSGPNGVHLASAVNNRGFGGGEGDRIIKIRGASGLSTPERYNYGYLEHYSGTSAGYTYRINVVETGATGTTHIKLAAGEELLAPLSSDGYWLLRPSEFYGMSTALSALSTGANNARGVGLIAATTSGYMLLQTKGQGLGICHSAGITSGQPLAVQGIGRIGASQIKTGAGVTIATALEAGSGAGNFIAVNWCLE